MSLRRFCGWEPAEYTTYEHDDHGRVARSVTRREAEWDDGQRLWMLALSHYEASLCRKCGHDLHDTTSAGFAWVADEPTECKACSALGRSERMFAKKAENDASPIPLEALIHTVQKVPYISPSERKARKAARKDRAGVS